MNLGAMTDFNTYGTEDEYTRFPAMSQSTEDENTRLNSWKRKIRPY